MFGHNALQWHVNLSLALTADFGMLKWAAKEISELLNRLFTHCCYLIVSRGQFDPSMDSHD